MPDRDDSRTCASAGRKCPSWLPELFMVAMLVLLFLDRLVGFSRYLMGRYWPHVTSWMYTGYFLSTVLLPFLCSVGLLVRGVLVWRRSSNKTRAAMTFLFLLIGIAYYVYMFSDGPLLYAPAHGFRDWVRAEVDIPAIRAWQETIEVPPGEAVPRSDWPRAVRSLAPSMVVVGKAGTNVDLAWNTVFGIYGVATGPKHADADSLAEHRASLPLEPGVYVWRSSRMPYPSHSAHKQLMESAELYGSGNSGDTHLNSP